MRFRSLPALSFWIILCTLLLAAPVARADSPNALPKADPSAVGMDAETLAKIAPRMQEFVEEREISGAVTLAAKDGKIVHLQAVGQANIDEDRPMQTDTLFAVASMTKPITATAVMILQDEGKLSIEDPISKHLPEFADVKLKSGPPSQPVTIRDALTHTAGFHGSQRTEATLAETAQQIAKRGLIFEPSSQWAYSPGLSVCGRIIEVVSGKSYDEFLRSRIFSPLGMNDTTFEPTSEQRRRLAQLYQPSEDGKSLATASHWLRDDAGERAPNPSGGLYSTAEDMAKFYQMILSGGEWGGERILSAEAVEEMTSIQTGDITTGFTPGNGWGLGWCVVREPQGVTEMLSPGSFGHGGAFGTQGWVDPKREMIFVLMIQRTRFGNSDASEIRRAFQELAVDAVAN